MCGENTAYGTGSIIFAGDPILKIDGTTMPSNVISGLTAVDPSVPQSLQAADIIDLNNIANVFDTAIYTDPNTGQSTAYIYYGSVNSYSVAQLSLSGSFQNEFFAINTSQSSTELTLTEGNPIDLAVKGSTARAPGISGAGITVGIISTAPTAGEQDEGQAMAQVVRAIAPGANVMVEDISTFFPQFDMVEAIQNLQKAGANIIVDDVGLVEPNVGGDVANAIDQAVAGIPVSDNAIGLAPIVNSARPLTYFTAAGNTSQSPVISGHALDPEAITVAAVNWVDTPFGGQALQSAPYSSPEPIVYAVGYKPDISATDAGPTDNVPSATSIHASLNPFFGTSAAAPAAAGVAALMMQENNALEVAPAAVKEILKESAIPFGNPVVAGAGLIQADKAVLLAANFKGGKVSDGYISGATVFADASNDGRLEPGDVSATTDPNGSFGLVGGSGPLIAFGGVDTSTGLPFLGELSAPASYSVITPLTTLVEDLQVQGTASPANKVLAAFGLPSTLDLSSLDPIAAVKAGDTAGAAAEIADAEIYDTVSLVASAVVGAGGSFGPAAQGSFATIANMINNGELNLTDTTSLSTLVSSVAQLEHIQLGQGAANGVASMIAASNTALVQTGQLTGSSNQLLNDTTAIEFVAQEAASTAVQQAGNSPSQIQSAVAAFTGANFDDLISAVSKLEVNGQILTIPPTVTAVTATTDSGATDLDAGHVVTITVATSEAVIVTGTPTLQLNDNEVATYRTGSGSKALTFTYTVQPGDNVTDLQVTGLNLPNGATVTDGAGNALIGNVAQDLALQIDTTPPTVTVSINNAVLNLAGTTATVAFTFSEAPTTFTLADTNATGGTLSNLRQTDTTHYTATFTANADTADINDASVSVTAGSFHDNAGNPGEPGSTTFTVDTVAPVVSAVNLDVAAGATVTTNATHGVLLGVNAPVDALIVTAVDGSSTNVGQAVTGTYGALTLDADGSYTYTANSASIPYSAAEDNFTFTVTDADGNTGSATMSELVYSPGSTLYIGTSGAPLTEGNNPNVIDGRAGNETIIDGNGQDAIFGGPNDIIKAGNGSDEVIGGANNTITLGNGPDKVVGGPNNKITVGNGADTIIGGPNDTIVVGNGADLLVAAPGDRWAFGNGPDVFAVNSGFGNNTITNFNPGQDVIQFNHALFSNFAAAMAHTQQVGANTVITYDANDAITLNGVTASSLHSSNFRFV
jgi:VCBS repeat-containing protein